MDTSTIEALRVVFDEIIAQGNIKTFQITKSLYKHCKLAHSRYKEDQSNKNKDKQVTELTRKRKILQDDLLTVKKKKSEKNLITTLTAESDSYVEQAAAEAVGPADMKLLILKAQSFKDIVKKKKEEVISLTSTIEKMEGELKSMK